MSVYQMLGFPKVTREGKFRIEVPESYAGGKIQNDHSQFGKRNMNATNAAQRIQIFWVFWKLLARGN